PLIVQEVRNGPVKKIWRRLEISVKDGHKLSSRRRHALAQRPRLIPFAVRAVQQSNIDSLVAVVGNQRLCPRRGVICGVVQNLNFQALPGILQVCRAVDEAVDDKLLMIEGQLNSYRWQGRGGIRRRRRITALVQPIKIKGDQAQPASKRQSSDDDTVENLHQCTSLDSLSARRTTRLLRLLHVPRGTRIRRPQPRQTRPISTPRRTTSHSSLPHG